MDQHEHDSTIQLVPKWNDKTIGKQSGRNTFKLNEKVPKYMSIPEFLILSVTLDGRLPRQTSAAIYVSSSSGTPTHGAMEKLG